MEINNKKIITIILICWVLFTTVFIFVNSGMDYNASHGASGEVTDMFVEEPGVTRDIVEAIIRKTAHMLEFGFLGMGIFALTKNLSKNSTKSLFGYALFYALAVGVIDEHIQSFSDRSSSTGDIIIDFVGVIIGFLVMLTIVKIHSNFKQRSKRQNLRRNNDG